MEDTPGYVFPRPRESVREKEEVWMTSHFLPKQLEEWERSGTKIEKIG